MNYFPFSFPIYKLFSLFFIQFLPICLNFSSVAFLLIILTFNIYFNTIPNDAHLLHFFIFHISTVNPLAHVYAKYLPIRFFILNRDYCANFMLVYLLAPIVSLRPPFAPIVSLRPPLAISAGPNAKFYPSQIMHSRSLHYLWIVLVSLLNVSKSYF